MQQITHILDNVLENAGMSDLGVNKPSKKVKYAD